MTKLYAVPVRPCSPLERVVRNGYPLCETTYWLEHAYFNKCIVIKWMIWFVCFYSASPAYWVGYETEPSFIERSIQCKSLSLAINTWRLVILLWFKLFWFKLFCSITNSCVVILVASYSRKSPTHDIPFRY